MKIFSKKVTFISLGILVGAWITGYFLYAPSKPILKIIAPDTFIDGVVEISGNLTANCRCEVSLTIDDKKIDVQQNGDFSVIENVSEDVDGVEYKMEAIAKPFAFQTQNPLKVTEYISINRKELELFVNAPSKTSSNKIEIEVKGTPNSSLIIRDRDAKKDTKGNLGESGVVKIPLEFNTSPYSSYTPYDVIVDKKGYAETSKTISVDNENYDESNDLNNVSQGIKLKPTIISKTVKDNTVRITVCTYAQIEVETLLKSPSSAVFPACIQQKIGETGPDTYRVESYVDAQNSFGAMIRSDFSCEVRLTNTDEYFVNCNVN